MRAPAGPALGVWFAGRARSTSEQAYLAYLVVMVGLVVGVPILRAVYFATSSGPGYTASQHVLFVNVACAATWVGAIAVGRERGPALYPPVLTHAFAGSPVPRLRAFARPVVRAVVVGLLAGSGLGAFVMVSLAQHRSVDIADGVIFGAAVAAAAVIGVVLWLAGQALDSRHSAMLGGLIAAVGLATTVSPTGAAWSPVGLVGATYPLGGSDPAASIALGVVALVGLGCVPPLVHRLRAADLMVQANRWDAAHALAMSMEFSAIGDSYRSLPRLGRRWFVVRPARSVALTIVKRDLLAPWRTPMRMLAGLCALAAAGALTAQAMAEPAMVWLGAVGGLLAYAGAGPLTDGIRHLAAMVRFSPLYGMTDSQVFAARLWAPSLVATVMTVAGSVPASIASEADPLHALAGAVLVGIGCVQVRIGDALKGPMPLALLTPSPTPMGDPSAITRLVWALDAVLLAMLTGVAAATVWTMTWLAVVTAVIVLAVVSTRWSARRRA